MGLRCLIFLKSLEGVAPTILLTEPILFKNGNLLSKSINSFFSLSYSESDTLGLFLE